MQYIGESSGLQNRARNGSSGGSNPFTSARENNDSAETELLRCQIGIGILLKKERAQAHMGSNPITLYSIFLHYFLSIFRTRISLTG